MTSMLRHIAMFKWNDEIPAGHVENAAAALDALPGVIPEIVVYSHGPNLGINPGTWDYAVIGDFASPADQATYRDHPQHQQFIADYLTGFVSDRAAVQFALPDGVEG